MADFKENIRSNGCLVKKASVLKELEYCSDYSESMELHSEILCGYFCVDIMVMFYTVGEICDSQCIFSLMHCKSHHVLPCFFTV